MDPIYLDHNATTPIDPRVAAAMQPWLAGGFGNPSSAHALGRAARAAVDRARAQVAALLGCAPDEVVFTSGGTESDNHAVLGTAYARRDRGRHLITSRGGPPRGARTVRLARDGRLARDPPAGRRAGTRVARGSRAGHRRRDGAGLGDARQQRGRHHRADPRARRHRPRPRRLAAHRRRAIRRQDPGERGRPRRRPAHHRRPQGLRAQGCRRALRAPWRHAGAAAAGRGARERPARRHRGRAVHRGARRGLRAGGRRTSRGKHSSGCATRSTR